MGRGSRGFASAFLVAAGIFPAAGRSFHPCCCSLSRMEQGMGWMRPLQTNLLTTPQGEDEEPKPTPTLAFLPQQQPSQRGPVPEQGSCLPSGKRAGWW